MGSGVAGGEKVGKSVDIIIKVLCVLVAFMMWIYVMMVESPEYEQVFSRITVDLVNTDSLISDKGLAIYSGYGTLIDVTLSGKKSVVTNLTEKDIVVTADVSAISDESGRYNCKVTVDVPAGCKLVGMSQDTVSVYIDAAGQTNVNLTERLDNTNLPDGCFVGTIEFPLDKVTVEGPTIVLSRVDRAVVDIDMAGVTRTATLKKSIYLVDVNGDRIESPYINYYPREIEFDVPIMKTARVPLNVYFKHGFLNSSNTSVAIIPETIDVVGDSEIINAGALIASIEIDEKTEFTDNRCNKIVTLSAVDGVTLSSSKAEVTAIINKSIIAKEITVPAENVRAIGVKPGVNCTWDRSPVNVTIIGREEDIEGVEGENIMLVIDMSPYSDSNTGSVSVKAEVVVDSQNKGKIIEVGTYAVNVRFVDPSETNAPNDTN